MLNSSDLFVGILGDGQLARLMCQEAHKLNIQTAVLSTSNASPACLVNTNNFIVSQIDKYTILNFAQYCLSQNSKAVLTIESEFLDPEFLQHAQDRTEISILPRVNTLAFLRDRKPQKEFLTSHRIPTSRSYEIESLGALKEKLSQGPLVLKKRLFGYDGYGTIIMKNAADISQLGLTDLSKHPTTIEEKFAEKVTFQPEEWIFEDFISFKRELAISFARNAKGQVCTFPWVETFQKDAKCLWAKGPVALSSKMQRLQTHIANALHEINYIGFITFEVFETKLGDLLINEVAPRVHNSAHYSLEALYFNQFKAHLYAILNLDLPKAPCILSPFAMYNLIASKESENPSLPSNPNSYFLNWYQKKQGRPGRKMGHMTCLASTYEEALSQLKLRAKDFDL